MSKRFAAGVAAATAAFLFTIIFARTPAAAATYATGSTPVVLVTGGGDITVDVWNQSEVSADSRGQLSVRQVTADVVARRVPREIPVLARPITTSSGTYTLPPESFVVPAGGTHDGIAIHNDDPRSRLTIKIPQDTAFLLVSGGRGRVRINGFRNHAFLLRLRTGAVTLRNVSGEGFVQVLRGPVRAVNSSFSRLRARTVQGGITLERCHARDIEATSILGTILFDNGSFEPGLARFESQQGNVGIGIGAGSASITAHGNAGVASDFHHPPDSKITGRDGSVSFGRNGPAVTAVAGSHVLLFDGSIRAHRGAGQFTALLRR